MAFTYAPDFIITHKRKRSRLHAVDPCLGFYPEASSSSQGAQPFSPRLTLGTAQPPISVPADDVAGLEAAHIFSQGSAVPQLDFIAHTRPYGTTKIEDPNATESDQGRDCIEGREDVEAPLTVEAFLKSAAIATKRYRPRRRKRKAATLHASGDHEGDGAALGFSAWKPGDADHCDAHQSERSSSPGPPGRRIRQKHQAGGTANDEYTPSEDFTKQQARKRRKSLPARLLTAAVATGVDVIGGLLFPDPAEAHISAQKPLHLVPGNHTPSPVDAVRSRRRRFVDPRRVAPFGRAVSQFAPNVGPAIQQGVKENKPITSWGPNACNFELPPGIGGGKFVAVSETCFTPPPLALVPATHPQSAYRAQCTTIINRGRPVPKRVKNKVLCSGALVLPHSRPSPPISPSTLSMSSDLARPDSDPILSVSNSSQPVLFPPDALVMPSADLVSQDSDSCERDAQSIVEHSANVTRAPSPSMVSLSDKQPLLSFPLSALPAHQHPRESSLASSRGQDPPIALLTVAPKKPLKSLGSLLDGLREIARNATQLALSSENSRSARPRPNTSSGAHGPLGSTLSSSARPRPSTACPLSASRSVCAAAHPPPHARLLEPPHFPHGLEGEENTRCVGGQPASSMDIGTGGPVDTLNTEDGPSRMNHIDLSAVFESRMSKVLHLPSSPLPVWDVLPLSHPVTLDEDDVCY